MNETGLNEKDLSRQEVPEKNTGIVIQYAPSGTAMERSDDLAELLTALASGDRNALSPLYSRTSAKLFGVILPIVKDRDEAEEILQQVYVSVWKGARTYDSGKGAVITWLCTIARNRAIDWMRKESSTPPFAMWDRSVADQSPNAEALAFQADEERLLAECLDSLEDRHRSAIHRAFFEGATYATLAKRDSVPLGTMKSRIRRTLLRLKECLEP
ncbi:hypothetical protein B5C34_04415 [Pacificimonas flava]|uniref:RNA polymerase sigma factor n=2 Tax=Pacificimonas TaxID=1960290 RepID=A0A219B4R2_9SPHN|nr:hypothetical protein B5C34_04415 [Pacificimonas flava]